MNEDQSPLALATIRRNRGVTLEEIAESTKISVRSLRAIESGEFRKLPGGIYNTNYIRQYARAIEFDEATLLAEYYSATGSAEAGSARTSVSNGKTYYGRYNAASDAA